MTKLLNELNEISKLLQFDEIIEARKKLNDVISQLENIGKI